MSARPFTSANCGHRRLRNQRHHEKFKSIRQILRSNSVKSAERRAAMLLREGFWTQLHAAPSTHKETTDKTTTSAFASSSQACGGQCRIGCRRCRFGP